MRILLLVPVLLLLAPLLAFADSSTPVYSDYYINPLDEKWREPVTLAEVTEYHACAGEPAYVNISQTPEAQAGQVVTITVRIDYLENGTEKKIFEAVNVDTTYYPNGKLFQYFPTKEGDYVLTRVHGWVVIKRTYTIDCTYTVPVPVQPAPLNCDDSNACTVDSEANGACVHSNVANGTICDQNMVCTDGACAVPPSAPQPPTGEPQPAPVTKSEAEIAAFNSMENAKYTIDTARNDGADVSGAEQWLNEARAAYSQGNFARAKELAEAASSLAAEAPRPPAQPEVPAQPPQPGGGFQLPAIALPSIQLDMTTISMAAIAIIILAVIAFFIRARGRREGGGETQPKQPPKPPENVSPEQLPSSMRPHGENESSS